MLDAYDLVDAISRDGKTGTLTSGMYVDLVE